MQQKHKPSGGKGAMVMYELSNYDYAESQGRRCCASSQSHTTLVAVPGLASLFF